MADVAQRLGRAPHQIAELVELVRARTPHEGKLASALPELFLCRYDAPRPPVRNRSSAMWVSMAVQGKKLMRVDGLELSYDPLSYLVLRGDTEFEAQPVVASRDRPYLAIVLSLPPQLVTQVLLEVAQAGHALEVSDAEPPPPAFTAPLDSHLIDGMCRLLRTLDDPLERRLLAPLALREIVLRLTLTHAARILRQSALTHAEREPIRRAMAHIEARACERLSVESIARHVGMSASHFAHRFTQIASVSPMRYQKHVRLERARELLLTAERAGTVAERVGYLSPAQFARDFKRQFGLSPASYARAFEQQAAAFALVAAGAQAPELESAGSSKKNAGRALGGRPRGR